MLKNTEEELASRKNELKEVTGDLNFLKLQQEDYQNKNSQISNQIMEILFSLNKYQAAMQENQAVRRITFKYQDDNKKKLDLSEMRRRKVDDIYDEVKSPIRETFREDTSNVSP